MSFTEKEINENRKWIANGLLYGYPICCIKEFIANCDNRPTEPRKLTGTGYVPCIKCNNKSNYELLVTIHYNRTFKAPFPIDESGYNRSIRSSQ